MDYYIELLSEKHLKIIGAFSCIECTSDLITYNSKERRKIKKHSKEMDDFLIHEALDEQNRGLNATHLFISKDTNDLIAYVSLCNDSIKLAMDEKNELGFSYSSIPAMKIARLAVSNKYRNQGFGKLLINYSVYLAKSLTELSGIAFVTLDCYKHRLSYYESIGFVKNQSQIYDLSKDYPISLRLSLNDYLSKIEEEMKEPVDA